MAEEKKIELKFVRTMEKAGWIAPKLSCPGFDGMPDRMILKDNGQIFFAEIKAPGEEPRPLQRIRHKTLRNRGFRVYVVDSEKAIYDVWRKETAE
ncbi:MAG: VRR-NUC domain-containing protein [Clostridia bacterium]|nr:VRR-NUC domain-containing protein [Clostridia bacterium]